MGKNKRNSSKNKNKNRSSSTTAKTNMEGEQLNENITAIVTEAAEDLGVVDIDALKEEGKKDVGVDATTVVESEEDNSKMTLEDDKVEEESSGTVDNAVSVEPIESEVTSDAAVEVEIPEKEDKVDETAITSESAVERTTSFKEKLEVHMDAAKDVKSIDDAKNVAAAVGKEADELKGAAVTHGSEVKDIVNAKDMEKAKEKVAEVTELIAGKADGTKEEVPDKEGVGVIVTQAKEDITAHVEDAKDVKSVDDAKKVAGEVNVTAKDAVAAISAAASTMPAVLPTAQMDDGAENASKCNCIIS